MGADNITKDSTMQEILEAFPGAQARSSVGITSAGAAAAGSSRRRRWRRSAITTTPVDGVIRYLQQSHERDQTLEISPEALAEALKSGQTIHLLDVRTPEEHTIARIDGARLVTDALAQEIVEQWPKDTPIVVHCHVGQRSLEAATFLVDHGFTKVKSLTGGSTRGLRGGSHRPQVCGRPAHCK